MTDPVVIEVITSLHIVSLALWFGGLFAYLVIVWPAIMTVSTERFPRAWLARVGMRTGPWIYLAMGAALVSVVALWILDAPLGLMGPGGEGASTFWPLAYLLLLVGVVANNVYGTLIAWPRIMLLPETPARRAWLAFRVRMGISLGIGLALHGVAVATT